MFPTSLLGALYLVGLLSSVAAGKGVIELTDENFDAETSTGVWMVKVHAPWCQACRQIAPLWEAFAKDPDTQQDGINVAEIDGTQQRALMTRLGVKAFPTLYLLREGRTYTYSLQGPKSVAAFREFAVSGFRKATPLPFYQAPNSAVGRVIGRVVGLPDVGMRFYRRLKDDHGLSDTAIVLGFLAIPVAVGGVLICALDAMYVRRAREEFGPVHEHQE
ncbi:hypothetical protein Agub_g15273 [Astrephomene gubernaculifera]|uniref:Thioredoxin domain-containing protein n=1 Tax=Astrephomene gubernaculifera TaxID=47775 RepID=A0AAD3E2X3_9CHLO|nr:hypothetical protein Agub_g15273 [Astrephomene gubernaculifera]